LTVEKHFEASAGSKSSSNNKDAVKVAVLYLCKEPGNLAKALKWLKEQQ
jgi:hypothetical protein